MQSLRNARFIARLVLAWFVLAIGVAAAAPVLQPQSMELVCSGGEMRLMVKDAQGEPASGVELKCPLCLVVDTPPLFELQCVTPPLPLGHVLQSIPAARIAALTAAPLPARGPPASEA